MTNEIFVLYLLYLKPFWIKDVLFCMKNIVAIIPARMGSTRFPGKPLEKICGMPMIGHVWHRAKMSNRLSDVYVVTYDQEIKDYVESIGGKAIVAKGRYERCPDCTAEALETIEKETGKKVDIVVMIQGDEPMLIPETIDAALKPIEEDPTVNVVNLYTDLKTKEEHEDPNEPKVVVNPKGDEAVYFSREPIPSRKLYVGDVAAYKQVCIIPFRRDTLLQFRDMERTPLEIIEAIDMLRFIENGMKVHMVYQDIDTYAVDTPKDLEKVESILSKEKLSYL